MLLFVINSFTWRLSTLFPVTANWLINHSLRTPFQLHYCSWWWECTLMRSRTALMCLLKSAFSLRSERIGIICCVDYIILWHRESQPKNSEESFLVRRRALLLLLTVMSNKLSCVAETKRENHSTQRVFDARMWIFQRDFSLKTH